MKETQRIGLIKILNQMNKLTISNISKTYSNGVKALDNVSLEINAGLFGLLGPNGAGKSSLMRTIATLQEVDGGSIKLNEINVLKEKNEVRKVLGYLPQEFGLYPRISAERLLDHLSILKGRNNKKERSEVVKALLHKVNLYEHRKKRLGGFSGGMKQRFGIAQALLANPKLLIVDEPTAGLDPTERNRFHNLLCEVAEKSIIILSTHIVDDVKELCSDMAIINSGRIMQHGKPMKLIDKIEGRIYKKNIDKEEIAIYRQKYMVIAERLFLGKPVIYVYSDSNPGLGFESIPATLDDVFFTQTYNKDVV